MISKLLLIFKYDNKDKRPDFINATRPFFVYVCICVNVTSLIVNQLPSVALFKDKIDLSISRLNRPVRLVLIAD